MLFSFKEFSVLFSRVISWKEYFGVGYWYWLDRVFEKKLNFWYSDYTIHETLCKCFLNYAGRKLVTMKWYNISHAISYTYLPKHMVTLLRPFLIEIILRNDMKKYTFCNKTT